MPVNITYMGTKKELAPLVADVIRQCQSGLLLDVFAGMCSVAEQVGTSRQIWTNDIQMFASEVGTALFASRDEPLDTLRTADLHFGAFDQHRAILSKRYALLLDAEDALLECDTFTAFSRRRVKEFRNTASHAPKSARQAMEKIKKCKTGFLDAISVARKLRSMMQALGFTIRIYTT
jgi:adenine-specific DNA methylase